MSVDLSRFERYEHPCELKPPLTLAMAAAHALLTTFLHIQGVIAALWAQVAGDSEESTGGRVEAMPIHLPTAGGTLCG
jgi:hypothetical protein